MHWTTLLSALALAAHDVAAVPTEDLAKRQFAQAAMMRFQCSQLVYDRIDPLVQPGMLPSTHMHQVCRPPLTQFSFVSTRENHAHPHPLTNTFPQIVGGNSFNATMTSVTYDPATKATCTTCDYAEDFSNYWTANLYFRAKNGTYKRVPQMVNLGLQGREGVTVYYIPPYDGKSKVTAFPKVCMHSVLSFSSPFPSSLPFLPLSFLPHTQHSPHTYIHTNLTQLHAAKKV